ncbi:hypothetical protein [Neorhizobium galegae]|uniref:Uncharacterized protein n=1 Tax=Neorhizobium galegae bv. orientalis str. HAMBI 540 TaxID=1028800 RepID=A0A068SP61_NEOGA|nr:hypothetical protein [Neorhizobium galegae]MCQ1855896.1 hypothetical protein [Neorhizobium galegae]CDN47556.1 Hypothetical protein RG540_CH13760 [Neorhizobium galegae bv. orientalis str. HAMBI 540]
MFDRSYRGGDHYSSSTHIKQQPHDAADAARLYGEVEAKAEAKVKRVVHEQLDSIKAEFVKLHAERSVLHFKDNFLVLFKVNGKGMEARVEVEEMEKVRGERGEIVVYRKIAEGITEEILRQLVPHLYSLGRGMR